MNARSRFYYVAEPRGGRDLLIPRFTEATAGIDT